MKGLQPMGVDQCDAPRRLRRVPVSSRDGGSHRFDRPVDTKEPGPSDERQPGGQGKQQDRVLQALGIPHRGRFQGLPEGLAAIHRGEAVGRVRPIPVQPSQQLDVRPRHRAGLEVPLRVVWARWESLP
jgi:hypothetical protein